MLSTAALRLDPSMIYILQTKKNTHPCPGNLKDEKPGCFASCTKKHLTNEISKHKPTERPKDQDMT